MRIEEALAAADALMLEVVASDVEVLEQASRHIIGAGGKRIRPQILFLSYEAVGGTNMQSAVSLAAAVELVHTATLVHDDINDHGIIRRGRATVNEKWGRTFALLTGDFLFTKVYTLMAPYEGLNTILAEATVALVEGETLQADAAKSNRLNREVYQQIVAKKTASLFRASALLGAHHGHGEARVCDALGEYGFYLGLVFQIVDDLLDLTGDARLMGKATGVDLGQGKGVASAYVIDHRNGKNHQDDQAAVAQPEIAQMAQHSDPFLEIKQRLIAAGAIDEGLEMARLIAAQANTSLDQVPQSRAVGELRELITLVLERQK